MVGFLLVEQARSASRHSELVGFSRTKALRALTPLTTNPDPFNH